MLWYKILPFKEVFLKLKAKYFYLKDMLFLMKTL